MGKIITVMVELIYENGKFNFPNGEQIKLTTPTVDVSLVIKDIIPLQQKLEICQKACDYLNALNNTDYTTFGIGDRLKTGVEQEVSVIREMTFRMQD